MTTARILYVSAHPLDANDGPALHIRASARELAKLGVKLTLLGPCHAAPHIDAVEVVAIPIATGRRIRRVLALETRRLLSTGDWGLVYMRGSLVRVGYEAKASSIPIVVEYNGVLMDEIADAGFLRRALYRREETVLAEIADWAVAVDDSIAARMGDLYHEVNLRDKITTVENGCEAQAFAQALQELPATAFPSRAPSKLVFVGALQPWTQLTRAFAALKLLPARYTLTVIGDGPERARFEGLAAESGVAVEFLGVLPHQELVQRLPTFDIGINPDAGRKSSPLKVPEYLAAGLVVVSCGPPSLKFLRDQGFGEWLEGIPQTKSFALAIERVSSAERFSREERIWRSNWAVEHRSWAASAANLWELLRERLAK